MEIKKRIEKLLSVLKSSGIDRATIEADLNYSENYVDQVLAKGGNDRFYKSLKTYTERVLGKATSGIPREISENNTKSKTSDASTGHFKPQDGQKKKKITIPFYDAPAAGGITETDMSPIHAPSGTIDVGDLLHDSQAAIRIYGNSMLPNYPPGCVVGLSKCSNTFIEPGEVYVIETRDRRILKRLFYKNDKAEAESFTCYSDNIMKFEGGARDGRQAYPPFDLPKKEIINLFVVTGVIKRNANSIIINR